MKRLTIFVVLVAFLAIFSASHLARGDEFDEEEEHVHVNSRSMPLKASDDWDEFEGARPKPTRDLFQPPPPPPQKASVPPPSPPKEGFFTRLFSFLPLPDYLRGYEFEILAVSFVIAYAINFARGAAANATIAAAWTKSIAGPLTEEFAQAGPNNDGQPQSDSYTVWKIACTGRVNCIGMEARIELARRQDLVTLIYNYFRSIPHIESVIIDVALDAEAMDKVCAAIATRSALRVAKGSEAFADIVELTKERETPASLSSTSLVVASDTPDALELALPPKLAAIIKQHAQDIRMIHITDSSARSPKYPKALRFEFRVPPTDQMDRLVPLYNLVFQYIDYLYSARLSPQAREKAEIKRLEAQKKKMKSEEAKEKRQAEIEARQEEKRRKEKERLALLSPEERAKEEEKIRKRQLRKQQSGRKQRIILK